MPEFTATPPRYPAARIIWALLLLLSVGLWLSHPIIHAGEASHGPTHHCSLCMVGADAPPAPAATVLSPVSTATYIALPSSDAPRQTLSLLQAAPRAPPVA